MLADAESTVVDPDLGLNENSDMCILIIQVFSNLALPKVKAENQVPGYLSMQWFVLKKITIPITKRKQSKWLFVASITFSVDQSHPVRYFLF